MKHILIVAGILAMTSGTSHAVPKCSDPGARPPCPPRVPDPEPKPSQPAVRPGDHTESIQVNGLKRTYVLHIPVGYNTGRAWPLVFLLHGMGGDGNSISQSTGMSKKADAEHFIAVYPNALNLPGKATVWNAKINPSIKHPEGDNDVKFLTELLDKLEKDLSIDVKRVYFSGFSSGANMSYRAGAALSHRLAAIGIVSGTIGNKQPDGSVRQIPNPAHSLPLIAFHGKKDKTIFYDGNGKFGNCLSVAQSIGFWVEVDRCDPTPKTEELECGNITKDVYSGCADGGNVELYTFKCGEHAWPKPVSKDSCGCDACKCDKPSCTTPDACDSCKCDNFPATDMLWEFFSTHPLP